MYLTCSNFLAQPLSLGMWRCHPPSQWPPPSRPRPRPRGSEDEGSASAGRPPRGATKDSGPTCLRLARTPVEIEEAEVHLLSPPPSTSTWKGNRCLLFLSVPCFRRCAACGKQIETQHGRRGLCVWVGNTEGTPWQGMTYRQSGLSPCVLRHQLSS